MNNDLQWNGNAINGIRSGHATALAHVSKLKVMAELAESRRMEDEG